MSIIIDGTGGGFRAKVDSSKRLLTRSISVQEDAEANANGDSYVITDGGTLLTSASQSTILFFQTDNERDLKIDRVLALSTLSTGATLTAAWFFSFIKNPTSISEGTDFVPSNNNFGSANTLEGTYQKGAEGVTLTGGTPFGAVPVSQVTPFNFPVDVIIPKGQRLGVNIIPPPGNTLFLAAIVFGAYLVSKSE